MEMMLQSKIVSKTLKAKGYDLNQLETGRVTLGEDLRRLLEKLADDKRVVRNNDKDKPEITILKRGEAAHGEDSMTGEQPDCKEVVRTLVEKLPEDILVMSPGSGRIQKETVRKRIGPRSRKNGRMTQRRVVMTKTALA